MYSVRVLLLFFVIGIINSCHFDKENNLDPLLGLIDAVEDSTFQQVINNPETFQYQIRYTQVDRDQDNRPILTTFQYNTDHERYFYPASTVKMPVAFLALQRINELHGQNEKIDKLN